MYVALFWGNDDTLGRTIQTETWEDAVRACQMLAKENQEEIDKLEYLEENGVFWFDSGNSVHIGKLEEM